MELSTILLSKLLFYSFLLGLFLGAINDVSRIIRVFLGVRYSKKSFDRFYSALRFEWRREAKRNDVILNSVIFLQDIIFMIMAASGIVILNYYLNYGDFRFFTVISMCVGIVLWYMSLGKLIVMFSEPIVVLVKRCIYIVVCIPMIYVLKVVTGLYKKIYNKALKAIANSRNVRYNKIKKKYYSDLSLFGFVGKCVVKG